VTNRMRVFLTAFSCLVMFTLVASPAGAVSPLTPDVFRSAYNVNPLIQSGYTGKGVTVAIIGQSVLSTFDSDVKEFSTKYGLSAPIMSVVQPFGATAPNNSDTEEITADTEFVHAMAPDAKLLIVLVENHTTLDGFSYVIDHNAADIATMSFDAWYYDNGNGKAREKVQSYNEEYAKSVGEKITLISGSGDFGSNNTVPWPSPWKGDFWANHLPNVYMIPQYSPYVTIVGGTALLQLSGGTYSETGWNQSGGGPSNLFPEPSWQVGNGVPQDHRRNIPDIALDASCDTPYSFAYLGGTWFCGTSAAAPTFAGIMADIVQAAGGRLGFINPTLYELAATDPTVFHDVTSGCSLVKTGGTTQTGYCAGKGWDAVTGWGSIDATKLAKHLAPNAKIVTEYPTGTTTQTVPIPLTTAAASTSTTILGLSVIALPFIVIIGLIVFVVRRGKGKRTPVTPAEVPPSTITESPPGGLCMACGAELKPGKRFCEKCGTPVSPQTQTERFASGGFCAKCGVQLKLGKRFCEKCGAPVPTAQPTAPLRKKKTVASAQRADSLPRLTVKAAEFCGNCGAQLAPNDDFCTKCGARKS